MEVSKFKGIRRDLDDTDIPRFNATDTSNIDISVPGELSNIRGYEKQVTTGYTNPVVQIIQIGTGTTLREIT